MREETDLQGSTTDDRSTLRRVLVIEDNLDAAESLKDVLEMDGHTVAVAHDGQAGLALAREFAPEVVLCDIGLPGGFDGYAVARAFRQEASLSKIHLIALTGYTGPENERLAHDAGFDGHLAKPPDINALSRTVAEAPTGH